MSSLFIGEFKRVRVLSRAGQLWKSTKISKTKEPGLDLVCVAGLVFVFIPDSHLWRECLFEEDASQSKLTSGTTLPKEKLTVWVYPTMSLIQDSGLQKCRMPMVSRSQGHLHYPDRLLSKHMLSGHETDSGQWVLLGCEEVWQLSTKPVWP